MSGDVIFGLALVPEGSDGEWRVGPGKEEEA